MTQTLESNVTIATSRNGELFLVIRIADPTESSLDFGAEVRVLQRRKFWNNSKVSALAVTHLRGVDKDSCPIKVETIPIGCQLDGSGSKVRLVHSLLLTT